MLGAGITRCEQMQRIFRTSLRGSVFVQESRNAEIQQTWLTAFVHKDVCRLQIQVQHKLLMRGLHGLCDAKKKMETGFKVKTLLFAPGVDALAIDVLKHKIGAAVREQATVKQACDTGMRQSSEDLTFLAEAHDERRADDTLLQDLQRYPLTVFAICPLCKVDGTHTTAAKFLEDAIVSGERAYKAGWVEARFRKLFAADAREIALASDSNASRCVASAATASVGAAPRTNAARSDAGKARAASTTSRTVAQLSAVIVAPIEVCAV